jgi:hypothetical protein
MTNVVHFVRGGGVKVPMSTHEIEVEDVKEMLAEFAPRVGGVDVRTLVEEEND